MAGWYEVVQGDCLSSIAQRNGLRSWKLIWDDPNNKDFKAARKDPNVLYPGDQLFIPDAKPSTKKENASTDKVNKFKVKLPKTFLRIQVKDLSDKPLSGKSYTLTVGDDELKGKTDGDGIVEQKINPTMTTAQLVVWLKEPDKGPRLLWDVAIGHLDPVDTIEGIQARLNNLGFFCGDIDGEFGPVTATALKGFQKANGLDPAGDPTDDATQKKLLAAHGDT